MKTSILNRLIYIATMMVVVFGVNGVGRADVVKAISVGGVYDNHSYGSYAEESDYITQVSLYLARQTRMTNSEFEAYYSGSGNIFAQSNIRTFTIHRAGLTYAQKMAQGQGGFAVGGQIALRLDRSYYDIYDYFGGLGYVSGKWYVRPSVLVGMRYRLKVRSYWNLDNLSHTEHDVSAQVSKFLPSRTTVRGEVSFGYKDYRSANTSALDGDEIPVPNEGQMVMALQVAQSLGRNTGMSVRYQTRLNTTTDNYHLVGDDAGYGVEDDLFNDRYDYEGHKWTVRLTQRFAKGLQVVVASSYERQNYDGRTALDLMGALVGDGVFRKDRITSVSLSAERPLTQRVDAWVWYGFENSQSNDAYYDYKGRHNVSMGFNVQF